MKAKLFFGAMTAFMAASCASATQPSNFDLKVNLTPDEDGMMVYITNFDNGNKIDSAIVDENGIASFTKTVDTPFYGRMLLEGERIGDMIIEPGKFNYFPAENRRIEGDGVLNERLKAMSAKLSDLAKEFQSQPNDSAGQVAREDIYNRYNNLLTEVMEQNIDNPLGYTIFIEKCQQMDLGELDQALEKYPHFKESLRVQKSRNHLLVKEETSVGHKYKDFEITYDGTTKRLSDYVGDDHYTLVDFWASWCGPCIREIEVIKKLYEKYNGKGLEFLGVAVWDQPEKTIEAVKKHSIPWNVILDAQTIPTDLYGISGIPCIILIAPDGTIVSRDKQDEDLVADVESAMAEFNENK